MVQIDADKSMRGADTYAIIGGGIMPHSAEKGGRQQGRPPACACGRKLVVIVMVIVGVIVGVGHLVDDHASAVHREVIALI